jgi:tetratricopeptide (TPR) repeat protein
MGRGPAFAAASPTSVRHGLELGVGRGVGQDRRCGRAASASLVLLVLIVVPRLATPPRTAQAGVSSDSPRRHGAPGMLEFHTSSLLVDYYQAFLRDQDIDAFRQQVSARYMEGTLARQLDSPDPQARRAAVLALGLFGSFEVNAAVARALRDDDATVRSLAENALWAIWFRADTPENNAMLEQVGLLIHEQRFEEAIALSTRLVSRAPRFAEAYNKRAIAEFFLGRYRDSAEDCLLVLVRNPYHLGALAGLAKCQLKLGQREPAIETLRRASKLQPHNQDLREWIAALEAGEL